jgi:YtxH-like protein
MKLSDVSDLSKEDVLSSVGLATNPDTTQRVLNALGYFGAGLVVGAGAALLFAPKSGRGLREDIGERLSDLRKGDGAAAPNTSDAPKEART